MWWSYEYAGASQTAQPRLLFHPFVNSLPGLIWVFGVNRGLGNNGAHSTQVLSFQPRTLANMNQNDEGDPAPQDREYVN